jgi:hypothetical protein
LENSREKSFSSAIVLTTFLAVAAVSERLVYAEAPRDNSLMAADLASSALNVV